MCTVEEVSDEREDWSVSSGQEGICVDLETMAVEFIKRRSVPQHGGDQAEKRLMVGSRLLDAELVRCDDMTHSAVYKSIILGPDRVS